MLARKYLAMAVAGALCQNAVGAEGSQNGGAPAAARFVDIPFDVKETSFHFKKEKMKDDKGEVIGEGKKLPTLKLQLPVRPSADAVLKIIEVGGKELDLLLDTMQETVEARAREIINAWREKNEGKEVPADVLADAKSFAWSTIANLPKSERGLGIEEAEWDAFFADYRAVMPGATGKDKDRIEKHVAIYKRKFQSIRNDKKALSVLDDMLALYATATPNMEDNQKVYDYLKERVTTLKQEEEKVLAEAL